MENISIKMIQIKLTKDNETLNLPLNTERSLNLIYIKQQVHHITHMDSTNFQCHQD